VPKDYFQTAQIFLCYVTPEKLASAIVKNGYPALIMSDNPSELTEMLSGLSMKTLTSEWVAQAVKELVEGEISHAALALFSLIVEQELCSDARVAVLSRFSTVSQRVISLRRGEGYQYWRKQTGYFSSVF
jgi:hypothetical protein